MKEDPGFPPGWDEARVRRLLEHYESQTEEQAVAEDEESLADKTQPVMEIPNELVPAVRELLSRTPIEAGVARSEAVMLLAKASRLRTWS